MRGARFRFVGFGLLGTISLLAGCSEELGPEVMPTTRVQGSVTVAGRPVTSGWIEFIPIEGTVGNMRSARIGRDGSFRVDRVAVGKLAVGVANVPPRAVMTSFGPVSLGLFNGMRTPIRRTIPGGSVTRVDLDLAEEAQAYQGIIEAMKRPMAGPGG